MRAHVAGDQRIAVVGGVLGLGGSGGAAGADHILDHDLLAERARHMLADDAGNHVGRTACGKGNDQGDRPRGVILRQGAVALECKGKAGDRAGNGFKQ